MKFLYVFIALGLIGVLSIPILGQSHAQVTWNTFEEKDGLFSMQVPSNWNVSEVTEAEKLAPIDFVFRYNDKGNSFAWIELMISEPLYPSASDALKAYMSAYQHYNDFNLLKPINCKTYILNDAFACSFLSSLQLEGEQTRNTLDVVSINPNSILTNVVFVASSNIYEPFLPVAEYIINSLSINSTAVKQVLENESAENIKTETSQEPITNHNILSQKARDFVSICSPIQIALYHSCNELINLDGSLSYIGQSTVKCITSGSILGGLASFIIPPDMVIEGLDILSKPTGCTGLVKMDVLKSVVGIDNILAQLGNVLR